MISSNFFLYESCEVGRYDSRVIPTRWANVSRASRKLIPSYCSRNEITSPPIWHPKHLKLCRSGETIKLGDFSEWNGHSPLKCLPAFLSTTFSPMISTISILLLTCSTWSFISLTHWLWYKCSKLIQLFCFFGKYKHQFIHPVVQILRKMDILDLKVFDVACARASHKCP